MNRRRFNSGCRRIRSISASHFQPMRPAMHRRAWEPLAQTRSKASSRNPWFLRGSMVLTIRKTAAWPLNSWARSGLIRAFSLHWSSSEPRWK